MKVVGTVMNSMEKCVERKNLLFTGVERKENDECYVGYPHSSPFSSYLSFSSHHISLSYSILVTH